MPSFSIAHRHGRAPVGATRGRDEFDSSIGDATSVARLDGWQLDTRNEESEGSQLPSASAA